MTKKKDPVDLIRKPKETLPTEPEAMSEIKLETKKGKSDGPKLKTSALVQEHLRRVVVHSFGNI